MFPLLPLLLLLTSPTSSSSVSAKPDLASDNNILPDNIPTYSAMSVGTYSLPALPYAYDVSSSPSPANNQTNTPQGP